MSVKQGCTVSAWLFNAYMDAIMNELKMWMKRMGKIFLEERREWRLLGLLCTNNLALCDESEEDMKVAVGQFAEVKEEV